MLCKHCDQSCRSLVEIWDWLRAANEKAFKSSDPAAYQIAYLRMIVEDVSSQLAHHVGGCQRKRSEP